MAPLILALDVGTSSTRAALFTTRGRRLLETTSHRPYTLQVAQDGTAELDIRVLEREVVRAIRLTLAARRKLKHPGPVIAVGASCFWHSLVGEKDGRPTPVYTWGDMRCRADADRLRAGKDEAAYHARTGCMLRTPYWPAKLRWLRRTGQTAGIENWMSPADWLYGRLCGGATSSLSMASGTGLLSGATRQWDPTALRLARISRRALPTLNDEPLRSSPDGVVPALHRFSELKDALWFPALGDGACSNLGSDATAPDQAALNFGTSGALRVIRSPRPTRLSTALFSYLVDERRALIGGAISNAGNLRVWALKRLRLPDDGRAIERALAAREAPHPDSPFSPFGRASVPRPGRRLRQEPSADSPMPPLPSICSRRSPSPPTIGWRKSPTSSTRASAVWRSWCRAACATRRSRCSEWPM